MILINGGTNTTSLPGSLLARPRGRYDERPWERGWYKYPFWTRCKQRCQDLCRKVHNRAQSFVLHTLFINYLTNTFLLVSSSVRSKQLLCFVQGQGQKRERKHTSKNFDEFHNHSPLLNVLRCASRENGIDQFQYIKIQHAATMYLFHRASTEVYLAQKGNFCEPRHLFN